MKAWGQSILIKYLWETKSELNIEDNKLSKLASGLDFGQARAKVQDCSSILGEFFSQYAFASLVLSWIEQNSLKLVKNLKSQSLLIASERISTQVWLESDVIRAQDHESYEWDDLELGSRDFMLNYKNWTNCRSRRQRSIHSERHSIEPSLRICSINDNSQPVWFVPVRRGFTTNQVGRHVPRTQFCPYLRLWIGDEHELRSASS